MESYRRYLKNVNPNIVGNFDKEVIKIMHVKVIDVYIDTIPHEKLEETIDIVDKAIACI